MAKAINQRTALNDAEHEALLDSILTDLTAIKTAVDTNASLLKAYTAAGTGYVAVAALGTTT